jgi:hypothetical protein
LYSIGQVDHDREHTIIVALRKKSSTALPEPSTSTRQETPVTNATASASTNIPTISVQTSQLISDQIHRLTNTSIPPNSLTPALAPNPAYVSTYEALYYTSFLASNAIYTFLDEPEIKWEDLRPKPRFEEEVVRKAVKEVLKVNEIREDGTTNPVPSGSGSGDIWLGVSSSGEPEVVPTGPADGPDRMEVNEVAKGREFLAETSMEREADGNWSFEVEVG